MKKIRHALEASAVRFAAWLVPRLPRRLALLLARALGILVHAIDIRGRRTARENLRAAFAPEHITEDQIRRIALASFQTFARTFIDLFWAARLNQENFRSFFHLRFDDPSVDELARARGAIWVTIHFGNFEILNHFWGWRGFPLVVVAQNFKNPDLTAIFTRLRRGGGTTVIPQEGAMLRLMKTLAAGGQTALLTDLNIKPGKLAAALRCFGLLTCCTTLHARLAMRLGLPVIACTCAPLPDGTYRVRVGRAILPADYPDPASMTQAVWNYFESRIRESPEDWLWMYKHWRYLPSPERDPRYPGYANYWKEFSKLIPRSGSGMV